MSFAFFKIPLSHIVPSLMSRVEHLHLFFPRCIFKVEQVVSETINTVCLGNCFDISIGGTSKLGDVEMASECFKAAPMRCTFNWGGETDATQMLSHESQESTGKAESI